MIKLKSIEEKLKNKNLNIPVNISRKWVKYKLDEDEYITNYFIKEK